MGAADPIANLLKEFKMPVNSDTSEIKNKYGKVIRDNSINNSNFLGSSENPGAITQTKKGIKNSKTRTVTNKIKNYRNIKKKS